jgi:hypothetical protein
MRTVISRWFLFGLLLGWALTHATVFGQSTSKTTSSADKIRAGLDKAITIDYNGQSLVEALNKVRDKSGIAINLDPTLFVQMQIGFNGPGGDPQPQIQIRATNEKASQVLRKFLNVHQLTYVVFEDSILITTEEMAVIRQYRQRVSVDLDEVPLKKALRDLAKNHGINLVIDPKVSKQAETPVSLQLENTGIETALRLLAELAGLKAVRMGNVMFVTSEETAKKIRKEEKQHLDNPVNPISYPPAFGGWPMAGRVGPGMPIQANPNAPGIDLPQAPLPVKQAPNKGESAPGAPPLPPPPPGLERPAIDGVPAPNPIPRVIRN